MASTSGSDIFKRLVDLIVDSDPTLTDPAAIIRDQNCHTASIAILDHGTISSYTISSSASYNTDSLFQACSISKPCAGLGIARLIDRGLFSLNDKVCPDLLPPNIVANMTSDKRTEKLMRSVTVRQLMSHTAGLSVWGFPGYPIEMYPVDALPDAAEIIAGQAGINTVQIKIIAPPGLEFMYSGGGMTVLQAIVEHKTRRPFYDVIREEVFEPLGMTRSFYRLPPGEENVAQPWYTGYTKCESQWHSLPELAAAGLWTTPADLLKLVRALQESIEEEGDRDEDKKTDETQKRLSGRFLTHSLAKQILTAVRMSMGLTWFSDEHSFGHGGSNNPGYECFLYGYADLPWNRTKGPPTDEDSEDTSPTSDVEPMRIPKGCGISVMTNSATGDQVVRKISAALAYLQSWPTGAPAYFGGIEVGVPFTSNGDIECGRSSEWKQWIGRWSDKDKKYTWLIDADVHDRPVAGVVIEGQKEVDMSLLKTAALPPARCTGEKTSIDLVLDGMEVMLRFGLAEDKFRKEQVRTVEMRQHQMQIVAVLYRVDE